MSGNYTPDQSKSIIEQIKRLDAITGRRSAKTSKPKTSKPKQTTTKLIAPPPKTNPGSIKAPPTRDWTSAPKSVGTSQTTATMPITPSSPTWRAGTSRYSQPQVNPVQTDVSEQTSILIRAIVMGILIIGGNYFFWAGGFGEWVAGAVLLVVIAIGIGMALSSD